MMKRMLLLPLALFATLVVAAPAGADTKTVQITKSGFTPTATTINVGDTRDLAERRHRRTTRSSRTTARSRRRC